MVSSPCFCGDIVLEVIKICKSHINSYINHWVRHLPNPWWSRLKQNWQEKKEILHFERYQTVCEKQWKLPNLSQCCFVVKGFFPLPDLYPRDRGNHRLFKSYQQIGKLSCNSYQKSVLISFPPSIREDNNATLLGSSCGFGQGSWWFCSVFELFIVYTHNSLYSTCSNCNTGMA